MPLLALAAYALASHVALLGGAAWPALSLLGLLLALGLAGALRSRDAGTALMFALLGAGLLLLVGTGREALALHLPPFTITLALFALFTASLRPGQTPLVTRLAERMEGELPAEVGEYTGRVTLAWSLFLAAMTLELAVLAAWAPEALWSLFANLINYLLLGLFFAAEYLLRRRLLPHRPQPGFITFLRRLAQVYRPRSGRP